LYRCQDIPKMLKVVQFNPYIGREDHNLRATSKVNIWVLKANKAKVSSLTLCESMIRR
jgi:hypothetical protein